MIRIIFWLVFLLIVALVAFESYAVFQIERRAQVVIADTVPYEQEGTGMRIVVAGDSTGYGTGAVDPRDSIAGRLGAYYPNASIQNISKNGYTVRDVTFSLENIDRAEVLLLQVGGNDILQLRSVVDIRVGTEKMLDLAKEKAGKVIFMSTGDVGAAPGFGPVLSWFLSSRTVLVRDIFMEVADERGVTYIDLYEPRSENQFLTDPDKYHSFDGLHPSGEGYGIWFEKLSEVL